VLSYDRGSNGASPLPESRELETNRHTTGPKSLRTLKYCGCATASLTVHDFRRRVLFLNFDQMGGGQAFSYTERQRVG